MTFKVGTTFDLGITAAAKIVPADDPEALGIIPAGRLISIDDAERLGITTEEEERAKANAPIPPHLLCPTCGQGLGGYPELAVQLNGPAPEPEPTAAPAAAASSSDVVDVSTEDVQIIPAEVADDSNGGAR